LISGEGPIETDMGLPLEKKMPSSSEEIMPLIIDEGIQDSM